MKVLIVGLGISGVAAQNFLESKKYVVEFAKEEDINSDINLKNKEYIDRLFCGLSFIVKSPGIPKDILLLKLAKERKIKIIGEFELGCKNLKGDVIAVTGTNGKTTTVSIIKHLLQQQNKRVFLAGNIGTAVCSVCEKTTDDSISVLECSSFQLENISYFNPHIAAILNFSPDHLNRHKTMKNYIKAKNNITKNQRESDFLIVNADDELVMKNIPKTKAQIYYFSTKKRVFGCFIKNKNIYFNDGKTEKKLVSLKSVKLVGEHNLSNILCAVLAVFLQTNQLFLLENISNFYGVSHRIEYVDTIGGVAYFNDSKATNIGSVLVAVKSFSNDINLILGGSDKGYDFDELFEKLPQNVKYVVAFGETSEKIKKSAMKFNFKNFEIALDLKGAMKSCKNLAKKGEIVLLSPACASFDQFKNYEERGNVFKKIVEEFATSENIFDKKTEIKKN